MIILEEEHTENKKQIIQIDKIFNNYIYFIYRAILKNVMSVK